MAGGPRRYVSVPIAGDRWRHQTVQGHIAHPPRPQNPLKLSQPQTVHGHISTQVTTPKPARPSARSNQNYIALDHITSPQKKRRKVEAEPPAPTRSLFDGYNKRKAATARFPPKITSLHIRAAMRKYEQVVQNACAGVETSCASCGEFMAKADSELTPIDDDRLRSMKSIEGRL